MKNGPVVPTRKERCTRAREVIKYINIIKYEIKSICPPDFPEERKQLLEMVGPELQSIYDDMGIEVSKRISFILVIELAGSSAKCVLVGSRAGAAGGHAIRCRR